MEAYNLYLKGRFELYKMTREGLDTSKKMFEEAIRLDPKYALAYDGLAYSWYQEGFLGFVAPKEAMPKAKAAVRRAIELDESVAEAHATLGVILAIYDWDWAGAERELIRSIELNGASPVCRDGYALFYFLCAPWGRDRGSDRRDAAGIIARPVVHSVPGPSGVSFLSAEQV